MKSKNGLILLTLGVLASAVHAEAQTAWQNAVAAVKRAEKEENLAQKQYDRASENRYLNEKVENKKEGVFVPASG